MVLQSRNFMRTAMDRGSALTLSLNREGQRVETVGPDDDATDSALLTVRMFKQDNDDLSLRNLAQKWLADPGISKELRDWVNAYRGDLNRHLDSPCMLVVDGVHITNRQILDTFLYGSRSHSDAAKEAQIK